MNFLEALKSNKPFKRKDWKNYYIKDPDNNHISVKENRYPTSIDQVTDILATDWVLDEMTIDLTRSEIEDAWIQSNANLEGLGGLLSRLGYLDE